MPVIKSAIKRVKQSEKRRLRNVRFKRTLKENTRALEAAISAKDTKNLDKLLATVYGSYDTAVKKNLIHKNKAARKKSSFAGQIKAISKSQPKKMTTKKPRGKKPVAKKS